MLETMFENALLDYYRGGNSYEDSVKKQLNALEATSLATTFAVSDMKSDLRKELRANTNELHGIRDDIRTAAVGMHNLGQGIRNDIQDMATGVTSAIQENTYAVVASQEMLAKTFQHGFNAVNNTLDFGFTLVGKKIDVLSDEIASKLDQIQDILNNPRLTQSRELYRQALISYKKGFFEEALKDCKEAVEKNTTDFISWYLLGLIYLYGAGENGNVIDLNNAEIALSNAAKYIKPDIPKSEEAKLMASEIYYNLGISRLIKSNDYLIENKIDDSNAKLLEAENASSIAYQLSKDNLVAAYEQAKELHFLGKNEEALKLLEELIRAEKTFALKAINDKNFESLWKDIEKLIDKLKKESCDFLKETLNEFIRASFSKFELEHELIIEKIKDVHLEKENEIIDEFLTQKKDNIAGLNRKKEELQSKYVGIEEKDYFTVLDILSTAYDDFNDFNKHIECILDLTKVLFTVRVGEQQEREEKERKRKEEIKREEERKRQEEEEEKLEREEQRRLEEEKKIRIQKEFETIKTNATKKSILSFFLLAIQWGIVLYFDYVNNNLNFLPIIAGIISSLCFIASWSSSIVGCNLFCCSAVASFILGHPIIGIINSFAVFFSGISSFVEEELSMIEIRKYYNNVLYTLFRNLSFILFVNYYIVYDDSSLWGIVLFILAAFMGIFSGIFGGILWILGAILLFFTAHYVLCIISIIVGIIAFWNKF